VRREYAVDGRARISGVPRGEEGADERGESSAGRALAVQVV
jgi:hypothetical protein